MEDEEKRLAQSGQEVSSRVFYMRQTISNACGTIALLHAVGNNMDKTAVLDDSFFKEFFGRTKGMTPAEIGAYLENPPADGPNIEVAHSAAASLGQTAPPQPGEVNLHFVTFVTVDGNLYGELGTPRLQLSPWHGHPRSDGATALPLQSWTGARSRR